jgi:hypothetical protein
VTPAISRSPPLSPAAISSWLPILLVAVVADRIGAVGT